MKEQIGQSTISLKLYNYVWIQHTFPTMGKFTNNYMVAPWEAPLSPIIANLVMEWFEQHALESYLGIPPTTMVTLC